MSRIRTIKPEFPKSESIGRLSREARLTFVQLWTLVDDEGRTRAAAKYLSGALFPYDDDARDLIGGWLQDLEDHGFIVRYTVGRDTYLQVVNWTKHQKIEKPTPSKLPAPNAPSPKPLETSRALPEASPKPLETSRLDLGPRTRDLEEDQDQAAAASQAHASVREEPGPGSDAELHAWLGPIVGTEPVALDVDLTPIRTVLGDPNVIRADVEAGISAALSRGRRRWQGWGQFDGWIRRAAKDRLGAQPRASPLTGTAPHYGGPRNPHLAALDAYLEREAT